MDTRKRNLPASRSFLSEPRLLPLWWNVGGNDNNNNDDSDNDNDNNNENTDEERNDDRKGHVPIGRIMMLMMRVAPMAPMAPMAVMRSDDDFDCENDDRDNVSVNSSAVQCSAAQWPLARVRLAVKKTVITNQ